MLRTTDRIELSDGYHLTMIDEPDADSLVRHLNEPEFSAHTLSIPHPYTEKSATWYINQVLDWEKENGMQKDWAFRSPKGEMIGSIGLLYDYGLTSHRSGMGYWLAKTYWNKGLMTECISRFTEAMFSQRTLHRLEAMVFLFNPSSARCLEKAGFIREGVLRGAILKDDRFLDVEMWTKLSSTALSQLDK